MYYPFIRGKQYDLFALRELAEDISKSKKILPIIEPVTINGAVKNSFKSFVEADMPFILITNTQCTKKFGTQQITKEIIDPILESCETYTPALYITPSTTSKDVETFCKRFRRIEKALIYYAEPTDSPFSKTILDRDDIRNHIFFDNKPKRALQSKLHRDSKVLVSDSFQKEPKNSLYGADDFFSDSYITFPNKEYSGFGDYSMVGKDFSETGGPAYAVAIHHIYINTGENNNLHVKHYVSDRTETTDDPAGKYIEALRKLIADLPRLGKINHTNTTEEYKDLFSRLHFPGLGFAKKLGIKHHLELMLKYYRPGV